MTAPLTEVLKDESNRAIPGSWTLFGVVAAGVAAVGFLAFLLLKALTGEEHYKFIAIVVFIVVAGVNVFLCYRMSPWLIQRVIFRLEGQQLEKVCIWQSWKGKDKESSNVYDLSTLTGAQSVGKAEVKREQDQVVLVPQRLLLAFWTKETLLLSRANVAVKTKGLDNDKKKEQVAKLEQDLASWNQICHEIEHRFLPTALAAHWKGVDPYLRYRLLVHQAELAYLQAEATAFRMCLASLHTVRVWGKNLTKMGWGSILLAFLALVVAAGFRKAMPYVGLGEFVFDKGIEPWVWVMLASVLVFAIGSLAIDLFEPLSAHLQRDTVREAMADQLLQAQVLKDDFDPILKFAKDDLDRIQADVTRNTVLTALTGGLTLFNQLLESWQSAGLLLIIASIFVLIQFYFHAQMQILRLTSTVCLIAQSKAPAKTPTVDDYSMD